MLRGHAHFLLLTNVPYCDTLEYRKVQAVLRKMGGQPLRLGMQNVTVLDSEDPLVRELRSKLRMPGDFVHARITRSMIFGLFVEDLYIYRLG